MVLFVAHCTILLLLLVSLFDEYAWFSHHAKCPWQNYTNTKRWLKCPQLCIIDHLHPSVSISIIYGTSYRHPTSINECNGGSFIVHIKNIYTKNTCTLNHGCNRCIFIIHINNVYKNTCILNQQPNKQEQKTGFSKTHQSNKDVKLMYCCTQHETHTTTVIVITLDCYNSSVIVIII